MNNLPLNLTEELKDKAWSSANNFGGLINIDIAINFWIREFGTSINKEDIDLRIKLFQRMFFLERKDFIAGINEQIIQHDYITINSFYLKDISSKLKGKKKTNDDIIYENYWLLVFSFFIVASLVAGIPPRQNQHPSRQQENVGFQTYPTDKTSAQGSAIFDKTSLPKPAEQPHPVSQVAPFTKKFSAVFVVNISHQNIIDKVKLSGLITPEISDDLCRATKALWAGELSNFEKTKLNKEWISSPQNAYSSTESTFDVYLIWVEFEGSHIHPGFNEKERLSSRLEAFQWLAKIKHRANVSQRLPDSSYTQTEVYRL